MAAEVAPSLRQPDGSVDADALEGLPRALRTRILKQAILAAGCPPSAITAAHVDRVEALVIDWHGQGGVDLPGGLVAERAYGRLAVSRALPVAERRRDNREE
jgi:tRNA(Ile)-lysidine synthase